MEFIADFRPTQTISVNPPHHTTTISVDPPGGTHTHSSHHGHPTHLPLPTDTFPSAVPRYIHAGDAGHTALFVFFVFFTVALLGVGILSLRVEKRARVFHWISAAILTIAMVSYLAMATGLGISYIPVHGHSHGGSIRLFRELYYARYIDWLFTTPLLLLSLSLLAGLSPASTLFVIAADVFMVVTGGLSALKSARYNDDNRAKWFLYAISCIGFLVIWITLFLSGRKAASLRPRKTRGLFYLLSAMTFLLWTGYPVVYGLTEGSSVLGVDAEIIAYGILDVAAKIGFTFLLLLVHTHGDDATWTLPEWFVTPRIGRGPDGLGSYGAIRASEE